MHKLAPYLVWILAAEDAVVALGYLYNRDWRMAIYWAAACVICAAVPK
jgi:hypothetical protein